MGRRSGRVKPMAAVAKRGMAMRVLMQRLAALPRGTQKRLAELAGLNEATLSRWKSGVPPRLQQLEALAEAMGVSICYLLDDNSKEVPKLPSVEPAADAAKIARLVRRAEDAQQELAAALDALRKKQ